MTDFELEQCIAEYGADIYSFCCSLTGSRQEADDLYQDIFLKAVEKKSILDSAGNPKSYLLSVAVRLWKNQRRKAAWRSRIAYVEQTGGGEQAEAKQNQQDSYECSPEYHMVRQEAQQEVRKAVDHLPDKMKVTVLLYYMEERNMEQIADILHIPRGTVKSRLHQARKRLEKELEYMLDE